MKDRLVTLIGGGGFLGRYVAQELYRAGARVRIAQKRPRDAWFLKPLGGLGQTQFAAADVTRPDTIARAIEGSDAVVNLAGTFGSAMTKVHVDGARNVAEAARAAGVAALVHVSALGADADSRAAYGRSKAQGEQAVQAAFPAATILRPSVLFGREDNFVNRFAGMIASAPVVPVLRAEARFQPAYVTDVATVVVKAIADPARHGGHVYTLGGPDVLTLRDLYRWIAGAIGRDAHFVELPDALGGLVAMVPGTPITTDQWRMLQQDNIVPAGAEGFAAFGITPTPLATVAPAWLVRFRRHGRFGQLDPVA
ncbi:NADH dehydrogenase [Sphingomonas naasensis]|uniref:Complex I NDUFA9 subunit family protein n=1 Tax=Sphingomonas naasensis TaxID=1344951 RepID=A0A4S1W6C8_9SPHN|nr:complex I NDUFA9 subunit family protein [Sphingomonas naasensis]NIJ21150.1 NADH dehydrogenase [Sphingomonas naasensis]TGX38269.1 complex I NDUFA9 subunit family protein [Sphingomonas naasensis]